MDGRRRVGGRSRPFLIAVTAAAAAVLAGCSSDPAPSGQPSAPASNEPATTSTVPQPGSTSTASDPTTAAATVTTAAVAPTSRLVARDCDTGPKLPTTDCWWLEVPEHRGVAGSRTIRLWVAIVRPDGADPDRLPVIDLSGGPGDTASNGWVDPDVELGHDVDHPIVVIDQRGTGRSQPRLDCPELDAPTTPTDPYPARFAEQRARLEACKGRLLGDGVDLAGYTTIESATDIVELRQLLGIDRFLLRGYSYGGRLAMEVARQDPSGVAGLVLDSALASTPRGLAPVIERADAAIDRLAAACAASPSCAANGDLRANLDAAQRLLDTDPYRTAGGAVITGAAMRAGLVTALTRTDLLPLIPTVLAQLAAGDTAVLESLADELQAPPQTDLASIASGTYMVVTCADDGPETAADLALREAPGVWSDEVLMEAAHCDLWDVDPDGDDRLPAPSGEMPVLAYTGEFDPWAPIEFADEIATDFPNITRVLVPANGHSAAFADDCTTSITLAFTADPATPPATTCVAALPSLFPDG